MQVSKGLAGREGGGAAATARAVAREISRRELWIVLTVCPFLLFPWRWAPVAAAAVGVTWLCRWIATGRLSGRTPADPGLALLLLMGGVSYAASIDRAASLPGVWRLVLGIAIFYALANGVRDRRDLRVLVLLLAAGGLGLVLLTLFATRWELVRIVNAPGLYDRLPRLLVDPEDGLGIHPRVMGMALSTVCPVAAAMALFGRDRLVRVACAVSACAMLAALPLTQSLGGIAAILAVLLVLIFWRLVRFNRWLALLLPASLIAAWGTLRDVGPLLTGWLLNVKDPMGIAVALRLDMWGRAVAIIRELPFTGIGFYTFPLVQTQFFPGYLLGPEPHAHNVFLQVALDLGLPGLVAFLWLFTAAGIMAFRVHRLRPPRDETALVVGLVGGLLAYLVSGQIDTLWHPKFGVLLWVLLGMVAATWQVVERERAGPPMAPATGRGWVAALPWRMFSWAIVPLVLLLAVLLFPGAWERNLGTVAAQAAVYRAREGGQMEPANVNAAEIHLQRAIDRGAGSAHVYGLLASVQAWRGDDEAALGALEQQVKLDLAGPMAEYAPFEALRRTIAREPGPGAAEDLLLVYGQWIARFGKRAENYAATATVYERQLSYADRARSTLERGLAEDAEPAGLLEHYLAKLTAGG